MSLVLQVDLWIQCLFFVHFSHQQSTELQKTIFSRCHLFWLFTPRSHMVWLLLSPLAGKQLCCPHLPPSLSWSFLTKCPFSSCSAACAVIVLHQGNNVAENKASHFAHHLLHLVYHAASQKQALTHFRGRWAWRGEGCGLLKLLLHWGNLCKTAHKDLCPGRGQTEKWPFPCYCHGGITQSDHIPSLVLLMATQMLP